MRTRNAARFWRAMIALLLTGLTVGGGPAAAPADSPWGANYFPNVSLVNQDGKTLRFYDDMIKDKVVLINFIYTNCHDACPLETAKLRQVEEVLGDRVGRDIFMYSITIDPGHDTPAALKTYAEKFMVGPGWQFLTGKESDITLLRKKLGLYRDETLEERNDHTASLIVGNEAAGQWLKRSSFDNPKVLARVLGDQLFNFRRPTTGERSYAEAPRSIAINPGEDLFRRRCQVCHTVGAGDTVGPDLLGVTHKRDRAWLARWMKTPDQMLAEKDPIAMALYEKYKQVLMPNLRLSDGDVEAVIGYLEAESQRAGTATRTGSEDGAHIHAHTATSPAPGSGR
jgi:protein SCO1